MKKIWRMLGCILYILAWSLPAVMADSSTDMFRMMQPIELNTQLTDLDIQVSLLYDNAYTEAVLLPGKSLTGELKIKNTGQESKNIQFILAIYDKDQTLCGIQFQEKMIEPKMTEQMRAGVQVPDNAQGCTGKVMIWDNYNNISPYTHVTITVENNDYFGDDYTVFQPLLSSSEAMGSISSLTDQDVFEFTPTNDGLYVFSILGDINAVALMYCEDALTTDIACTNATNIGKSRYLIGVNIIAGKKYYLHITGKTVGQYTLKSSYVIGNVVGEIYPVVYVPGEDKFNELAQTRVFLTTQSTNEFIASVELKEWSGYIFEGSCLFSLTSVKSGEYLVTIARPGYLPRYLNINLDNNIVNLGNKKLIAGDVNGDNIIDDKDLDYINQCIDSVYGDSRYDIRADLNGDKEINANDLALAQSNVNKTSNDYGENINAIAANILLQNNTFHIEGQAKANSTVDCCIYNENNMCIYDNSTVCDENGKFTFQKSVSRRGTYKVVLTAENRAFDIIREETY